MTAKSASGPVWMRRFSMNMGRDISLLARLGDARLVARRGTHASFWSLFIEETGATSAQVGAHHRAARDDAHRRDAAERDCGGPLQSPVHDLGRYSGDD